MRTIRARLTIGYAVALTATMFVFAATIYFVQRTARFSELDARTKPEADLIANLIASASADGPVVSFDPPGRTPVLNLRVEELIRPAEDYVLVFDSAGNVLYTAGLLASMSVEGGGLVITGEGRQNAAVATAFQQLAARAGNAAFDGEVGSYDFGPPVGRIRYYARPINAGPGVASILVGAPTAGLRLGPSRLLMGMLVAGPLIIVASALVGYFLTGQTLTPMDTIINEIEAIEDGRSLHRRVVDLRSTEELARLSTTLNNMLVRLERNFLSLRRFTADASHELKTPLTVLRAGVERAITHPKADPEVLEVLEETLVEVNRMTELVDSLLTLARADEGRAPLLLQRVDIRELLSEVAETASMLGEHAEVHVDVHVPEHRLLVAIDRNRIRQLFMNLLTNAIKFTPKHGEVKIACVLEGEHVVFVVRDTGVGIAQGELPYIFDRFWRADVARSRSGARPGVGLGLAICKWIAEAHGGSIVVESRRGQGTTFTVTLPIGEPTDVPYPPSRPRVATLK